MKEPWHLFSIFSNIHIQMVVAVAADFCYVLFDDNAQNKHDIE